MEIELELNKRTKNFEKLKNEKEKIKFAAEMIKSALLKSRKIFFLGNGGSASQSNHLACEFCAKFQKERKPYPALSLCANNSTITAISNDFGFENVFKRQIEAIAGDGDILVAISTGGKSKNVLNAIEQAKKQGLKTIFLTGENKTKLNCDIEINAPSKNTAEIQEMHITIGHIICLLAEKDL